ncbi:FtsX-like permease family protein [Rudaeicoccus suwonensis]|uniref:FtsX-like permease family protein n=1 Tax=Rudaeicoccus suwonensis TaxID=657409 RepID=UPI0014770895|nr:FtsX-like permease family protein [Rudaeicoccus suwonensis]
MGSEVQLTTSGGGLEPATTVSSWLDPRVRAVTGPPTQSSTVLANWPAMSVYVSVQYTQGGCGQVRIVQGRCPNGPNQVMMSTATWQQASLQHLRLGSTVDLGVSLASTYGAGPFDAPLPVTVVGVYSASADAFWGGNDPGRYMQSPKGGTEASATLLTDSATFAGQLTTSGAHQWANVATSATFPLKYTALTPQTLAAATAGLQATASHNVSVYESLSQVQSQTHEDVTQVRQILPVLFVQLGTVLLILLLQIVRFLADARRGEAAVLKMRGNGTVGVLRLGAAEFAPAYVLGALTGMALAYGVDQLTRVWWLPARIGPAWDWWALIAGCGAALVALGVWLACWWAMGRSSITLLLRARPPRRRGIAVSAPLAVLAAVCVIGVVLTATHSVTGALVQVTPVLLAGLVALVVAVGLAPVAAWAVRGLLAARAATGALAAAQLGRRAGAALALTTLIVTAALMVLSISVYSRGEQNRATRTAADLGASVVIDAAADSGSPTGPGLVAAVDSVDPHHREFSPAVEITADSSIGISVLGVVPSDMQRIGARTGLAQQVPWAALAGGSADEPAAIASAWTTPSSVGQVIDGPTMNDQSGPFKVVSVLPYVPGAGAQTIVVNLKYLLAQGDRTDNLAFQVFSSTDDPAALHRLTAALNNEGFDQVSIMTTRQIRAGYDATATAWASKLNLVVSALSVLAALASVALIAVASAGDRRRDLRALATGGVHRRMLRRATIGEFALLALVGSVIGAITAPVAAWLTGPTMLWWSSPPAQPLTRTGFSWLPGSAAAVLLVLALVVVAAGFGWRLTSSVDDSHAKVSE